MSEYQELAVKFPCQLIDRSWPYDGPHDTWTVRSAAAAIPHLVRYLNNATRSGHAGSLEYATTVYEVLTSLMAAMAGMDQLLRQLEQAMDDHASDPTLYDDRRSEKFPAPAVAELVSTGLGEIRETAAWLSTQLGTTAGHAGHLGNDD